MFRVSLYKCGVYVPSFINLIDLNNLIRLQLRAESEDYTFFDIAFIFINKNLCHLNNLINN